MLARSHHGWSVGFRDGRPGLGGRRNEQPLLRMRNTGVSAPLRRADMQDGTRGGLAAPVPRSTRLLLSVLLGGIAAALRIQDGSRLKAPSDFGQVWFAARALLQGTDPYPLIGPKASFDWPWPFVYPLSATPFALPFTPLTEPVASACFVAVGAALFAWALMEYGYGPLFGFFSWPVREAAGAAQWSLALGATFAVPAISWMVVAKPTIGAALFAARPRRSAVIGGLAVLAIVSVAQPA